MGGLATVVGASGFIGRRLAARLSAEGWELFSPAKGDPALLGRNLGCVFYCAGLTADFDARPFEAIQAHVGLLADLASAGRYERLVYLSSTRLYDGAARAKASETDALTLDPADPRHTFDLSKALGENLVLTRAAGRGRVVRLANVYDWAPGSAGFLSEWLIRARTEREIALASSPQVARDYIHLDDAVTALIALAGAEAPGLCNLASGTLTSNAEIAGVFEDAGWTVRFTADGASKPPPVVETRRLAGLGVRVRPVKDVVRGYLESLA